MNVTVQDPDKTAALFEDLFGWHVRWSGAALGGGRSVHVGTDGSYVALYTNKDRNPLPPGGVSYDTLTGLNHIAVVVDDLDAVEQRVREQGFAPKNHADYEPGRRFYFEDDNGLEVEVVQYD